MKSSEYLADLTRAMRAIRRPGSVAAKSPAADGGPTSFAVLLALLATGWLANFCLSSEFGIYDDDYYYTLPLMAMHGRDFLRHLGAVLFGENQGRPLGYALNAILAYFTGQGESLQIAYWVSFAIISANAFLVFKLIEGRLGSFAGVISALIYQLFPADLSKQILMHRVFIHLSMSCLLVGLLLYLSESRRRRVLGYVIAACSLLIWEAFYLPFLLAPLLQGKRERIVRRMTVHGVIVGLSIIAVVVIRYLVGEQRVNGMIGGLNENLPKMAYAMFVGPLSAAETFFSRPFDTILHADWTAKGTGLLVFLLLFFVLKGLRNGSPPADVSLVLVGGILSAVLPYVLMYRPGYFPPTVTIGRLSGLNAPAALGFAVIGGVIANLLSRNLRAKSLLIIASSLYFGVLAAFGSHIQHTEYVTSWKKNSELWKQILSACGDVEEGQPIVVDLRNFPATQAFPGHWILGQTSQTLQFFAAFPKEWKHFPTVTGYASWEGHQIDGNEVILESPPWGVMSEWPRLHDGKFLYLRYDGGRYERVDREVDLFGIKLRPKPIDDTAPALKPTPVGKKLLGEPTSDGWTYLRGQKPYP